jgi:hypothetical protein
MAGQTSLCKEGYVNRMQTPWAIDYYSVEGGMKGECSGESGN